MQVSVKFRHTKLLGTHSPDARALKGLICQTTKEYPVQGSVGPSYLDTGSNFSLLQHPQETLSFPPHPTS